MSGFGRGPKFSVSVRAWAGSGLRSTGTGRAGPGLDGPVANTVSPPLICSRNISHSQKASIGEARSGGSVVRQSPGGRDGVHSTAPHTGHSAGHLSSVGAG